METHEPSRWKEFPAFQNLRPLDFARAELADRRDLRILGCSELASGRDPRMTGSANRFSFGFKS